MTNFINAISSSITTSYSNILSSPKKDSKVYNATQRVVVGALGGGSVWSAWNTARTIDPSSDTWQTQCQKGAIATAQAGAGILAILAAVGK